MTIEEFIEKSEALNIPMSADTVAKLEKYAALLAEWNEKINLTSITEKEAVFEKHFYDSILPLAQYDLQGSACDVGTGAGFPGLVWKIVRPDLHVVLVEPTGKRCTFLKEVINALSLTDVEVVNRRAEEHVQEHREEYDAVTARAVANLRVLSELCIPLVKQGGLFIAMKGMQGRTEAEEAKHATALLGAELVTIQDSSLSSGDSRVNLYYRKTKATPAKYPRNYGQIKKKPL